MTITDYINRFSLYMINWLIWTYPLSCIFSEISLYKRIQKLSACKRIKLNFASLGVQHWSLWECLRHQELILRILLNLVVRYSLKRYSLMQSGWVITFLATDDLAMLGMGLQKWVTMKKKKKKKKKKKVGASTRNNKIDKEKPRNLLEKIFFSTLLVLKAAQVAQIFLMYKGKVQF